MAESHLALLLTACGNSSPFERESRATGSDVVSASFDEDHLASHLLKERAEDQDGLELGKVRDLVFEAHTGQAAYMIISSGGTLGFGKRLRAVPAQNVSTATTKVNTLAVNLGEGASPNSSFLTSRDLATHLGSSAQDGKTHRNFSGEPKTQAPLPTGRALEDSDSTPGGSRRFELASHLLGHRIANRSDKNIGKVTDLLVDLSAARPTYAIVSLPALFNRDEIFAMPLELLHCENGRLTTETDRNKLASAPLFEEKAWLQQRTPSLQIYKIDNNLPKAATNTRTAASRMNGSEEIRW